MEQSDVFISYRRTDVDFVKQLDTALKDSGREVWVDWEDIPPGSTDFSADIQRGIEQANAFIAVLSPDYLASTYCMDLELQYAIKLNKRIVPVVLHKIEGTPPPGLEHINWIYFTPHAGQENTFDEALPRLLHALDADYEHTRTHTRLLTRAREWEVTGRGNTHLLNGAEINAAETWLLNAGAKEPHPSDLHRDYIVASRRKATRQLRMLIGFGVLAFAVTLVLAVAAVFAATEANARADELKSLALSDDAVQVRGANRELALALALDAAAVAQVPQTQALLADLAFEPAVVQRIPTGDVVDVAFLPDGDTLVYAVGQSVVVYNLITDERLLVLRHPEPLTALDLQAGFLAAVGDAALVAVEDDQQSSEGGTLLIWDTATWTEQQRISNPRGFSDVALSPDAHTVATADGQLQLWSVDSGGLIRERDFDEPVTHVAYSPDGSGILAGAGSVVVDLDTDTGSPRTSYNVYETLTALAYSPDGQWIGIGEQADTGAYIRVYRPERVYVAYRDSFNYEYSATPLDNFSSQSDSSRVRFQHIVFSPDNKRLLAVGTDTQRNVTSALIWDVASKVLLFETSIESVGARAGTFSPDGIRLALGWPDEGLVLWRWQRGDQVVAQSYEQMEAAVVAALSPDGTRILTPLWENDLYVPQAIIESLVLRSADSGEIIRAFDGFVPTALAFSPDGSKALVGENQGEVTLLDIETGERLHAWNTGDNTAVEKVRITNDGAYALALTNSGVVQVWDVSNGTNTTATQIEFHTAADFSPDGRMVAYATCPIRDLTGNGCLAGSVSLFDLASGVIRWSHVTHAEEVRWLAFNADSTHIASLALDGTLVTREADGTLMQAFYATSSSGVMPSGLAFSPDGHQLITGGHMLQLWDLQTEAVVRRLPLPVPSDEIAMGDDRIMAVSDDWTDMNWLSVWRLDNPVLYANTHDSPTEITCELRQQFQLEPLCAVVVQPIDLPPQSAEEAALMRNAFLINRAFEGTGYGTYQNYDAGIVSYGIYQFNLANGQLENVINRYLQFAENTEPAALLRAYLPRVQRREETLRSDTGFKNVLIAAADDEAMRDAQDYYARASYWDRVQDRSIRPRCIQTALGQAMLLDIAVNHGSNHPFLQEAEARLGVEPGSCVGENGITEVEFIHEVARIRQQALNRFAERYNLPGLKARGDFWMQLIETENWNLAGDADGNLMVRPGRVVQLEDGVNDGE